MCVYGDASGEKWKIELMNKVQIPAKAAYVHFMLMPFEKGLIILLLIHCSIAKYLDKISCHWHATKS